MVAKFMPGFERHLKILQALSDKSVKVYSSKIREFFEFVKDRPPGNITRQDVERYLENCFYRGNTNETRLTKLVAIKKFFRYLMYEGKTKEDPTDFIPKPKIRKKFVQMFTKNEVLSIFSAIDIQNEKGLRDAVIIMLAVFCGLRTGEIMELTLQDIIDVGKSLDIHVIGKFGKERQIYLWKAPSEILRQWISLRISQKARASDPLLISYTRGYRPKGKKLAESNLDVLIKKYAAMAGVRKLKISMHMFRATHAHDLRHIQGYDTPAIAERLGHASIATTDRYIPMRGRIHKTYPSLAAYWREFNTIWSERRKEDADHDYGGSGNA